MVPRAAGACSEPPPPTLATMLGFPGVAAAYSCDGSNCQCEGEDDCIAMFDSGHCSFGGNCYSDPNGVLVCTCAQAR